MTDTIAPTPEWLARNRGNVEAPQRDQKVQRHAYRKLSPFETLARAQDIDDAQFLAAQKLTRHWLGSQGVDVRSENWNGTPGDYEYSRTYHSQQFAEARKAILICAQWDALMTMLDESGTPEDIGRTWRGAKKREIARAHGVALIALGLETLARMWGTRPRGSARLHPFQAPGVP